MAAVLAGLVAGCSGRGPMGLGRDEPKPRPPEVAVSPNGEPLSGGPLGKLACADAAAQWFGRVDANHDGSIDKGEFMADLRAQFARMDLDHDGFITPDELAAYRAPYLYRSEGRTPPAGGEAKPTPEGDTENAPHHRQRGAGPSHALPSGLADPVMSADRNLDFKVSLDEFVAQGAEVFARLDKDKDGRISRAEAEAEICAPHTAMPH
jgi:hypothetical protein